MKINSLNILTNQASVLNKKFFFISGNEKTLMEKIKTIIVESFKEKESVEIKNIDTINDFTHEVGLFGDKYIYIVNGNKGIDKDALDGLRSSESNFIFLQENSQKINIKTRITNFCFFIQCVYKFFIFFINKINTTT